MISLLVKEKLLLLQYKFKYLISHVLLRGTFWCGCVVWFWFLTLLFWCLSNVLKLARLQMYLNDLKCKFTKDRPTVLVSC